MTEAQHTFAIALFSWGSRRLSLGQRLFEPAVTVSVDQQMAKHEHDGMAVGNQDIEKSQVRYKGWNDESFLDLFLNRFLQSVHGLMLKASALTTVTTATRQ